MSFCRGGFQTRPAVSRGVQKGLHPTEILPLHSVKGKNDRKSGWFKITKKMGRGEVTPIT